MFSRKKTKSIDHDLLYAMGRWVYCKCNHGLYCPIETFRKELGKKWTNIFRQHQLSNCLKFFLVPKTRNPKSRGVHKINTRYNSVSTAVSKLELIFFLIRLQNTLDFLHFFLCVLLLSKGWMFYYYEIKFCFYR